MIIIYKSAEDYLEQILILLETKGYARSVDISEALGVTKPSVSVAMKKLREGGYISMEKSGLISLTDKGFPVARRVYDRHLALTYFFISIGVDEKTAQEDACKTEHVISEKTFVMICRQLDTIPQSVFHYIHSSNQSVAEKSQL